MTAVLEAEFEKASDGQTDSSNFINRVIAVWALQTYPQKLASLPAQADGYALGPPSSIRNTLYSQLSSSVAKTLHMLSSDVHEMQVFIDHQVEYTVPVGKCKEDNGDADGFGFGGQILSMSFCSYARKLPAVMSLHHVQLIQANTAGLPSFAKLSFQSSIERCGRDGPEYE
ncbi:hypothetical protein B0H19DRAFT_1065544 [Mycena capillaripes]|nr:hypothetical protein B0H19DRAFT_1065544 [Mycena capillaripes]